MGNELRYLSLAKMESKVEPGKNSMGAWCIVGTKLGGGFKYFLCSPLLGEDSHFEMGWNHQLVKNFTSKMAKTWKWQVGGLCVWSQVSAISLKWRVMHKEARLKARVRLQKASFETRVPHETWKKKTTRYNTKWVVYQVIRTDEHEFCWFASFRTL